MSGRHRPAPEGPIPRRSSSADRACSWCATQDQRCDQSVYRDLEAKAQALAGSNGYTTNLTTASPQFVGEGADHFIGGVIGPFPVVSLLHADAAVIAVVVVGV